MSEPKPFTDEDLKLLKEHLADPYFETDDFYNERLQALLARLEAAEGVCRCVASDPCRLDHAGNCQTHFISSPCQVEAWRKAAGK